MAVPQLAHSMLDRFMAWLRALNTHKVGSASIGALVLSILLVGGQHQIDGSLSGLHGFAPAWVRGIYDAFCTYLAVPTIVLAGSGAYLGRPKTVPADPS